MTCVFYCVGTSNIDILSFPHLRSSDLDSPSGLRIDVAWPLRRLPPWRWLLRARHRPALACTHAGAIEAVTEQGQYDGRAQSGGKKSSVHYSSPRPDPAEVAVAASVVAGVGLRKASW